MARPILVRGVGLGLAASLVVGLLLAGMRPQPAGAGATVQPAWVADDNATVCRETADTVESGLEDFVADIQQVSTQAQSGDLVGAEETVRHAGTTLTDVGGKLRQQGDADDATLRTAVADLAAEFESLGRQLNTLSGLLAFDTTRLAELAEEMGRLCGVTPSPGASFPGPIPSGSPGASPSGTR